MFKYESSLVEHVLLKAGKEVNAIIALDEVGRGCVAGPVLTCASLWIKSFDNTDQAWISKIKDSKKLTPQKRLSCFKEVLKEFNFTESSLPFKSSQFMPLINLFRPKSVISFPLGEPEKIVKTSFKCVGFCLGEGNLQEVEEFNIWNATQIAAARSLLGLKECFLEKLNLSSHDLVLLMDGNKPISVPAAFVDVVQATAVDGDNLFISVGLSSILAKVHRDLFMVSQEDLYPHYGFAKHKGYGTSFHLAKIQEHGTCPLHRLSFLKKYAPASRV